MSTKVPLSEFYSKAARLIAKNGKGFAVKRGTPEFFAWCEYFDAHYEGRPLILQRMGFNPSQSFTAPTATPQQFDELCLTGTLFA